MSVFSPVKWETSTYIIRILGRLNEIIHDLDHIVHYYYYHSFITMYMNRTFGLEFSNRPLSYVQMQCKYQTSINPLPKKFYFGSQNSCPLCVSLITCFIAHICWHLLSISPPKRKPQKDRDISLSVSSLREAQCQNRACLAHSRLSVVFCK